MANVFFSNVCRTCSCNTQSFRQLNAIISHQYPREVHELLQLLVPQLSVLLNDALPQQICDFCFNKLEMVYEFQQMCIKSELEFYRIVEKTAVDPLQVNLLNIPKQETADNAEAEAQPDKMIKKSQIKCYQCDECDKSFKKKYGFQRHQEVHSKERPFACNFCNYRFTSPVLLSSHMEIQHNEEELHDFGQNATKKQKTAHIAEHRRNTLSTDKSQKALRTCNTSECAKSLDKEESLCNESVQQTAIDPSNELINSLQTEEEDALTDDVSADNFSFDDETHAKSRERIKCEECGKSLFKKSLRKHQIAKHEKPQPFKCDLCDKTYVSIRTLKQHQILQHNVHSNADDANEQVHKCILCQEAFSRVDILHKHVRLQHENDTFSCSKCGKNFQKYFYLKNHMQTHSEEFPFQCDKCPKKYRNRINLRKHSHVHRERNEHKCDVCSKYLSSLTSLLSHKRLHEGLRPFQCDKCGRSFARRSNLNSHLLQHKKLIISRCKHCSRTFRNSSDLFRHVRRDHFDGFLYHCQNCKKKFKYKTEFMAHESQHFVEEKEAKEKQLMEQDREIKTEIIKIEEMID